MDVKKFSIQYVFVSSSSAVRADCLQLHTPHSDAARSHGLCSARPTDVHTERWKTVWTDNADGQCGQTMQMDSVDRQCR